MAPASPTHERREPVADEVVGVDPHDVVGAPAARGRGTDAQLAALVGVHRVGDHRRALGLVRRREVDEHDLDPRIVGQVAAHRRLVGHDDHREVRIGLGRGSSAACRRGARTGGRRTRSSPGAAATSRSPTSPQDTGRPGRGGPRPSRCGVLRGSSAAVPHRALELADAVRRDPHPRRPDPRACRRSGTCAPSHTHDRHPATRLRRREALLAQAAHEERAGPAVGAALPPQRRGLVAVAVVHDRVRHEVHRRRRAGRCRSESSTSSTPMTRSSRSKRPTASNRRATIPMLLPCTVGNRPWNVGRPRSSPRPRDAASHGGFSRSSSSGPVTTVVGPEGVAHRRHPARRDEIVGVAQRERPAPARGDPGVAGEVQPGALRCAARAGPADRGRA